MVWRAAASWTTLVTGVSRRVVVTVWVRVMVRTEAVPLMVTVVVSRLSLARVSTFTTVLVTVLVIVLVMVIPAASTLTTVLISVETGSAAAVGRAAFVIVLVRVLVTATPAASTLTTVLIIVDRGRASATVVIVLVTRAPASLTLVTVLSRVERGRPALAPGGRTPPTLAVPLASEAMLMAPARGNPAAPGAVALARRAALPVTQVVSVA